MTYFRVKKRKKMDYCTKEGVFYEFFGWKIAQNVNLVIKIVQRNAEI